MWRKSIRCCPLFLRQLSHQLVNHGKAFKSTPAVSVCLRETVKRLEPLPCTVCRADLGKTYLVGVNQALSWIVWHFIDIIWWHLCVRISNGVPERSSDRLGKSINSTPVISSHIQSIFFSAIYMLPSCYMQSMFFSATCYIQSHRRPRNMVCGWCGMGAVGFCSSAHRQ